MPSFLSRPTALPSYVDPIDTNSLQPILLYKQQAHDQGKQNVQNQINAFRDTLGNLVRESDRTYMQQKVDSYVEQINSGYGQADFGTYDTMSGITAQASIISKDQQIMGAIKDSRAIHSLIDNINKIKSDPKLMDRYAPQNENWDMRYVDAYLKDPNSRYLGSSTPTPYYDVDKKITEGLSKLKADMISRKGYDGYIDYVKTVGEDKIRNTVINKLSTDPRMRSQLTINQWNTYRGVPDEAVLAQHQAYRDSKLAAVDSQIMKLNQNVCLYPTDSKEAAFIKSQIDSLEGERKVYLTPPTNAEAAKNQMYMNDLVSGYVSQFSQNEVVTKTDSAWIAQQNLKQRNYEFQETYKQKAAFHNDSNYFNQLNYGLAKERLNLARDKEARELAESQFNMQQKLLGKTTNSDGTSSGTEVPIATGLDSTTVPDRTFYDMNRDLYNLQIDNQADLSNMFLELVGNHDPVLRNLSANLKQYIGARLTSAKGAYDKIITSSDKDLQKAGLTLGLKNSLIKMTDAAFRNLDATAHGISSARSNAALNNPIVAEGMMRMNERYVHSLNLKTEIDNMRKQALVDSGVNLEKQKEIETNLKRWKANPSLIPQEWIDKARTIDHASVATKQGTRRFEPTVEDLRTRAINLYESQSYNVSHKDLEKRLNELARNSQVDPSRKRFAFPSKLEKNAIIGINGLVRSNFVDQDLLENGEIAPIDFMRRADGSYDLQFSVTTGSGKDQQSTAHRVNIPQNQGFAIEQFLPKDFGKPAPYESFDYMLKKDGFLRNADGSQMGLYSRSRLPLPYSLQSTSDGRVRVIFRKQLGSGSTTWVNSNLFYPNAASAISDLDRISNEAFNKNITNPQRLIEDIINQTK